MAAKTLPPEGPGAGRPLRRQRQHRLDPPQQAGCRGRLRRRQQGRKRPGEPRHDHAGAKQLWPRQHQRQHRAQGPLRQRPRIVPLDPDPRLIDQVHVVHARRTGGHAGEAGQAAVDMLDHLRRRRLVLFQHLLDQVDPPARAIELVAEQHIGRTGRGAEPAMHAGAQDLVGFGDIGIGELGEREFGFHVAAISSIRPRLRMILGSKLWRTRWLSAATPPACGWKTSTFRLISSDARISDGVAAGGLDALTHQGRLRVRLRRQRRPDQAAAPIVDHVASGIARQRLAERAARGRRTDDPPHRPRAQRAACGERLDVADRAPDRSRGVVLQHFHGPEWRQRPCRANPARSATEAAMPSSRSSVTARPCAAKARQRAGRGAGTPNSADAPRPRRRRASRGLRSSPGSRSRRRARRASACARSQASASPSASPRS